MNEELKAKYMYCGDISSAGYAGSAVVLVRTERESGKMRFCGMRNRGMAAPVGALRTETSALQSKLSA